MMQSSILYSKMLLCVLVVVVVMGSSSGSYCTGGPSPNAKPNLYPITTPDITHVADYRFPKGSRSTVGGGGRLYNAVHRVGNTTFPVLHLYGTGYQMGYAQGVLLKSRAIGMWDAFWKYLLENVPGGESSIEKLLLPIEEASKP